MVKIKGQINHICCWFFIVPPLSLNFLTGAWAAAVVAVNPSRRGAAAPCHSSNHHTAPQTFPWGQEVTWRLTIPVHGIVLTILWGPPARRTAAMDAQKTTGCNMQAGHPGSTLPAPAWRPRQLSSCRGRGTRTLLRASVCQDLRFSSLMHTFYHTANLSRDARIIFGLW